jgi:Spy/CpxP family protein refolding chaperone
MKRLLIALVALVGISVAANAQTTPDRLRQHDKVERKREAVKHHRHHKLKRHHHRHHRMAELNLSQSQKDQAKLYREDYKKQMQALSKNENITVKEMRDKKMALRKDQAAKMQSLLTPEQKNKMEQLKAEDKAKEAQHYAARMDKMKTKLNLTDQQVAQMKTQREAMKAKFKAIKEDDKLDRTAKKEKLMALRSQMKEEHKKIFTPEQLQKMEEMKKGRMEKKDVK